MSPHILSLGHHFNVVGADVLRKTLFAIREVAIISSVHFRFFLATLKCILRQGLARDINYCLDVSGGNGMSRRRLGRVAIISSIDGLRPI